MYSWWLLVFYKDPLKFQQKVVLVPDSVGGNGGRDWIGSMNIRNNKNSWFLSMSLSIRKSRIWIDVLPLDFGTLLLYDILLSGLAYHNIYRLIDVDGVIRVN